VEVFIESGLGEGMLIQLGFLQVQCLPVQCTGSVLVENVESFQQLRPIRCQGTSQ
jgi:hypothetical protein